MLNLKQYIKNSKGEDLEQKNMEGEGMLKMELGESLASVLLHAPCPDNKCTLDYKLKRYNLFKKIKDVNEIELSSDEKEMLIELVNLQYDVFFTGHIYELLN